MPDKAYNDQLSENFMPTYDYRCGECGKAFSMFLSYAEYGCTPVKCPNCGTEHVTRTITPVRVAVNERSRLQHLAEESSGSDSSQMLGKVMRTIQEQSGRELPPDTNEALTRLEKGESPASIDKDYD